MTEEQIKHAFEPFTQFNADTALGSDGAGLGLALSRRIMELHGGTLTLECRPNEGCVARALFPAERLLGPQEDESGPTGQ